VARKQIETEYAVIGLNRLGASLARRLEAMGRTVVGIDENMGRVQELADEITRAVALDATDEDALREIDITAFQTVIVAVENDFEGATLITASLKKMGIPMVISQANTNRHRDVLLRVGADQVILPYEDSGERLAEELVNPGMLERMSLGADQSLVKVICPDGLVGKATADLDARHVTLVLILRGEELILAPDASTRIAAGDVLFVAGESRPLRNLLETT
jgi:trk system potassium uptake protein